jgi:dihydrofolate reductase
MPKISLIVAFDENRVMGKGDSLPWNIPEDMQHFRETTKDSVVIMGRKTFESIGRILPKRINIVLSSKKLDYEHEGLFLARSIEEALIEAKKHDKNIYFIGGSGVYKEAMNHVDEMILSHVKGSYEGDVYFPEFNLEEWEVKEEKDFEDFVLRVYTKSI